MDLYKRMKIKARKVISKFNKEIKKIGGGKAPPKPDDMSLKIADNSLETSRSEKP